MVFPDDDHDELSVGVYPGYQFREKTSLCWRLRRSLNFRPFATRCLPNL